jgi:brefeldin A-inhibited guanine nucleotide-exchange protein
MQSQTPTSSAVFLVNALDKIAAAREIRRNKQLKESVQNALGSYFYPCDYVSPKVLQPWLTIA